MASADVLPGDKSPTQEYLKALIYGTDIYLSPMHASSEVEHKRISSLSPYKLNIPEASRDHRFLGTAVEVALARIQGTSAEISRGVLLHNLFFFHLKLFKNSPIPILKEWLGLTFRLLSFKMRLLLFLNLILPLVHTY